jgi:hypothetical protein
MVSYGHMYTYVDINMDKYIDIKNSHESGHNISLRPMSYFISSIFAVHI